jgi:hypothetical protein
VAQVTISVATKDDGEDKQFEWRDDGIEQQQTTLTVSSSRTMWIRSKTAATTRPPRSWRPPRRFQTRRFLSTADIVLSRGVSTLVSNDHKIG